VTYSARVSLDPARLERLLADLKPLSDDPGYLVLADWLQTQQHPWGELIALQHAAATDRENAAELNARATAHLARHAGAILGRLAKAGHTHHDWHRGFLRRAVLGIRADLPAMIDAIETLLALPVARMVETIVLDTFRAKFDTIRDWGDSGANIIDPWTDLGALASAIPERITRLGFGGWPARAAAAYVRMPAFAKLSAAFPRLTALELTGWCDPDAGILSLPELVDLEVRFPLATPGALQAVASARLPKLARLGVWLGGASYVTVDEVYPAADVDHDGDGDQQDRYPAMFSAADLEKMDPTSSGIDVEIGPDELADFLSAELSPSLRRLELGMPSWEDAEVIGTIARSEIVGRIDQLVLWGGAMERDQVTALIAAKPAIARLELELRDCQVSAADISLLKSELPRLRARPRDTEGESFHFRYVATVE